MKRPTAFLELESFALNNNAEGDFNTANGAFALVANTTGERNTATGDNALFSNNTSANFLTAASVSRGTCAACGGCGFPRSGPTTFHIFYWLQVTNFSLLKSAPNGVN